MFPFCRAAFYVQRKQAPLRYECEEDKRCFAKNVEIQ